MEYSNLGVKPKEIVRSIRNEGNLVQYFNKYIIFEIMKKRKDLVILK